MFAQAVNYYSLYHIDHRKGLNKPMERKNVYQVYSEQRKEQCVLTHISGVYPSQGQA